MIDPTTLKLIVQAAVQTVTDEKAGKRLLIILTAIVCAVVLFLSVCFYVLTMPFQLLGSKDFKMPEERIIYEDSPAGTEYADCGGR